MKTEQAIDRLLNIPKRVGVKLVVGVLTTSCCLTLTRK